MIYNKLVCINVSFYGTFLANTNPGVIGTIPDILKPSTQRLVSYCGAFGSATNYLSLLSFVIGVDGKLCYNNTNSTSVNNYCAVTGIYKI